MKVIIEIKVTRFYGPQCRCVEVIWLWLVIYLLHSFFFERWASMSPDASPWMTPAHTSTPVACTHLCCIRGTFAWHITLVGLQIISETHKPSFCRSSKQIYNFSFVLFLLKDTNFTFITVTNYSSVIVVRPPGTTVPDGLMFHPWCFLFNAQSPRSLGRSPPNFATWLESGSIL